MGQEDGRAAIHVEHRLLNAPVHVEERPARPVARAIDQEADLDIAKHRLQDLDYIPRG